MCTSCRLYIYIDVIKYMVGIAIVCVCVWEREREDAIADDAADVGEREWEKDVCMGLIIHQLFSQLRASPFPHTSYTPLFSFPNLLFLYAYTSTLN